MQSAQNNSQFTNVQQQMTQTQNGRNNKTGTNFDSLHFNSSSNNLAMNDQTIARAHEQPQSFHQTITSNGGAVAGATTLPPITQNRSIIANTSSTQQDYSQVEKRRVFRIVNEINVTITQVGNNVISSKIDISNQVVSPDAMMLESDSQEDDLQKKRLEQNNKNGLVIDYSSQNHVTQGRQLDELINPHNSTAAKVSPELQIPVPSPLDYTTNIQNAGRNQNLSPSLTQEMVPEKYKRFDPRTLYIFSYTWRFRQIFIDFLSWKYYDYIMVLSIIGNSIVLALADYTDEDNLTEWNQKLDLADQVFTIIYVIEASVKIVAFGFIIHRKSYLRDPWNVIDFFVVVIGIISLIPNLPNLKSLRILRIFRPLRSINAVPSIKRLVATLLMSLPQMGYLVSFLLFFITIFAILGIQLFSRVLYRRCRLTDAPIVDSNGTMSWPIDPTQVRPCGGYYQCQDGTYCHGLIEKKLPLDLDDVAGWDYIQNGYFQFDNLGTAIMAIFRLITLEGWTYFMYLYMDSSGLIAGIYFPVLIVIGSFFFLNLFLAVITDTFSEMVKLQQQQEQDKLARLHGTNKKAAGGLSKDDQVSGMINVAKKKAQITGGIGNLSDAAVMFLAKAKEEQKRVQEENEMNQASILARQKEMKSYSSHQSDNALAGQNDVNDNQAAAIDNKINNITEINGDQSKEIKRDSALEGIQQNEVEVLQNTRFACFQKPFHIICKSILFILIINACIIGNTACLGLDYYPVDAELSSVLDKVNVGFFIIFFMEMIIKVIGLGPNTYIKDPYNIFDALIVTLSIIDVFVSATLPDDVKMGKGAISVFRAFRLLRVFKLAKSWKQLNKLIQTIAKSLKDISTFSILLFLLMFIYVLLGMQFFADKNHDQGRVNFKNFFNGFVLIFTVLTGENWDSNMFIFVKSFGAVAIVYFFTLIIIGQMIFMNVFQAILLENFENDGRGDDEESKDEQEEVQLSEVIGNFFSDNFKRIKELISQMFAPKQIAKAESGGMSAMISVDHSQQFNDQLDAQMYSVNQAGINSVRQLTQKPHIHVEQFGSNNHSLVVQEENILEQDQRSKGLQDLQQFDKKLMRQELALNQKNSSSASNFNDVQEPNLFSQTQRDLAIGNTTMYLNNIGDMTNNAGFSLEDTAQISLLRQYNKNASLVDTTLDVRGGNGMMTSREGFKNNDQNQRDNTTYGAGDSVEVRAGIFRPHLLGTGGNMQLQKSQTQTELRGIPNIAGIESPSKSQLNIATSRKETRNNFVDFNESRANMSALSGESPNTGKPGIKKQETKSIALILLQKSIDRTAVGRNLNGKNVYECEGNSLYCFGPTNKFRCYVDQLVKSKPFEYFILLLIAFSSVNLALDNPLNDPNGPLTNYLLLSDYVLTSFFICEGLMKIISQGFFLNGDGSYMKNGWNIIDFLVVVISVVSITVTGNKYKFVKIFRLLRILRPLRVVSKNKGLRIGIQALIVAIPRLFNVTIISLLFFIICGIIGVNYFKGTFYTCIFGSQFPDDFNNNAATYVSTKHDCLNFGGAWVNADQNFDNLPQAISTLFQMSTTEGWIDVMNRGVDAVGPDFQPIQEYNVYWSLFFMVFIFFGNFLILNLFTGVVCDTYNSEKEILGKSYLLSENQKKWLEYKKMCIGLTPKYLLNEADIGKFNITIYRLVTNKKFELFTLSCILLNTVTLCINWYSQSVRVDDLLDYINYGFAGIFLIEALLKLTAFGFRGYFRETGNIFDLVIVLSSIVSTIVSLTMNVDFGSSTTFIRALRMIRIFKLIKQAKGMRVIFDTLIITVPAITNIGGLLLLLLFMFSILGIFLFAEVKLQSNLDDHANFQSFGIAFLTLLRCSTGESWDYIMQDAMRQRSILFQCSDEDFDYDTYAANGFKTQGCGSPGAGMAFFIAYFLLIPLFFLDIFVAIIIEGFEQSSNKANNLIQEEDYEKFRDSWVKFDPDGTGFISIPDFSQLMFLMGEPLGWGPEYQNDINLQSDFLEELNIPTYNNFQDFLFYDVVQALTKVYLVNVDPDEEYNQANENQGLGSMADDDIQDTGQKPSSNAVVPFNAEQAAPANPQGTERKMVKRSKYISPEEKVERRIELEFEELLDDKKDVMEVEEIRNKYESLMKAYVSKQDSSLTSAHIKAGRKILEALRRLYKKKHLSPRSQQNPEPEPPKKQESDQFVLKDPKNKGYPKIAWEIEEEKGLNQIKGGNQLRMQPIIELKQ